MNGISEGMREVLPWIESNDDLPGVILADVTSRDGLQSLPWWNYWTKEERGELSKLLSDFGIHHIEVGFPAMNGDPEYDAVVHTAEQIGDRASVVMGLARLVESDVTNAINAVKGAKYRGVHTFIGTSDEHLSTFSFSRDDILRNVSARVSQIRDAGYVAQISAEDGTRTPRNFLVDFYGTAIDSGAQILNMADTAGVADPQQFNQLLEGMQKEFPDTIISTHTHNDKSQAESSSLIAASNGFAQRIEGTVFGIGERAGNADLMSLIAIITQDPEYSHLSKKLLKDPEKFIEVLEYMTNISGIHSRPVSPGYGYEAIVNRSGIHQAKVAKLKSSYIAFPGGNLGLGDRPEIELSALSGKGGVIAIFKQFGIELQEKQGGKLTQILRQVLSADTSPDTMHSCFPELSIDFLQKLSQQIRTIRTQARELKNTKQNLIQWNQETDSVLKAVYHELYGT